MAVVPIFERNSPAPDVNDAPPPYAQVESHGASATPESGPTVRIQPLQDKDGVILTVQPPKVPKNEKLSHVPCDIALVIDVSGSMGADAPAPGEDERTGISVLDLVKHACRTIMSTMTTEDRLAIVTFSDGSKVLQSLTEMTDANKETAKAKIEAMGLESCTNLWHGLRDGVKLFKNEANTGRVPTVMVLTDGYPNHMCPQHFSWSFSSDDQYWNDAMVNAISELREVAIREGIFDASSAVYPNYATAGTTAEELYGHVNAARLRSIKASIDPDGVMNLAGGFDI